MCLIIASQDGARPDLETLVAAEAMNPDGIGVVYLNRRGNNLATWRGFGIENLVERMDMIPAESPFILHFRFATCGLITSANCHPFRITGNLYMAHNGVLDVDTKSNPLMSDTWHFAQMLRQAGLNQGNIAGSVEVLADYVGSRNKLAFMDSRGRLTIVNRQAGVEWNGMWFSNDYSLPWQYQFDVAEVRVSKVGSGSVQGEYGRLDCGLEQGLDNWLESACDFCGNLPSSADDLTFNHDYQAWICTECLDDERSMVADYFDKEVRTN